MRKVAVFLNQCLPLSEVFVAQQTRAYERYKPTLVACRKVSPSVDTQLPEIILNHNNSLSEKISEGIFKATGRSGLLQRAVNESDIVHAHFGPVGWMASGLTQRGHKPLIVTCHGFDVLKKNITRSADGPLQASYAHHRKELGRRATAFLCVSDYTRKRAIEFGFPAEKCHTHYLGIPMPQFTAPRKPREAGQKWKLVAAGRLVPVKRQSKLIEAVSILQKNGYDVSLDILGDGPLREDLEKQAAQMIKNYKFHGACQHDRILSVMRESDIFCHSAMHIDNGQTEAFGLVLLEAQWTGLPVVTFASGGMPEAIKDGETGLLAEEGNADDLAQKIRTLIDNPELYARMAQAAPGFVANNFDNKVQTAKIEDLFDRVLAGKAVA